MINYGHGLMGFVLTAMSLVFVIFASMICFAVIIIIISHQYSHRLEREKKITLVLSLHIYFFLFIFATFQTSMNIQTLIGDIYGSDFYSSWCIFRTYAILVSGTAMYFTFVIQAAFRLCRIVYWNYRWLQSYRMFLLSGPILILVGCLLLAPLLIWHDIPYLPNEHYCYIVLQNARSMFWIMCFCYLMPIICLLMIHIRITIFLRQQPGNLVITIKQRQHRDLTIVRRIFLNVSILVLAGLPGTVFTLMIFITGVSIALDQRITLCAVEISLTILSIEMVFMTPLLKKIVMRKWQHNQVTNIPNMIQMRTIPTVPRRDFHH